MTFIVTFACKDFALLAADTRTHKRDSRSGPIVSFRDDSEKLQAWQTGWMVSAPFTKFGRAVRAGIPPEEAMAILEANQPDVVQEVKDTQRTFIVGHGAAGPFRRCLDWRGEEMLPGTPAGAPIAPLPYGADKLVWRQCCSWYAGAIKEWPELPAVLRSTAALFRLMYQHLGPEGSISTSIMVGIVHKDGHRESVGPQPYDTLLTGYV